MLYNLYLVFVLFFTSIPTCRVFFYREIFTLVSFIFSVPQAKTIVLNGKTVGQFNMAALAVNYIRFFSWCLMHASSRGWRPNFVYCDNIVRWMTPAVSLKSRTQMWKLLPRLIPRLVGQRRRLPEVHTRFHTRKYLRCVFRDVAHQLKLSWCSTVKKGMSAIVEKLFGM